jgi:hypothetical protein
VTLLRWTGWDGIGMEHAMVSRAGPGTVIRGVLMGPGIGWSYRIELDRDGRSRTLRLETTDRRRLALDGDGEGGWRDEEGRDLPALQGAIDLDLGATPVTNALPVRRLGLGIGEGAEIEAVHVAAPGLEARRARQRYTRLAERRYRYEGLDTGASCEIEVDAEGFVLLYPDLFRRLDPGPGGRVEGAT